MFISRVSISYMLRGLITLSLMILCNISWADDWYEFDLPWNDSVPFPVDMSQRIHHVPAGKHGPVIASKDALTFSDGTPVKFFGITMSVSNSAKPGGSPPEKKDAATVAKKLASMGFNHVRIVGFDGKAPNTVRNWLNNKGLASKQLDRLDYFVNELRKVGIYYSLSITNSTAELLKSSGVVKKNTGEKYPYRQYLNVRLFDEKAVNLIKNWVTAFYSRVNPYTKLSYAQDPANVYVSAVNEDTSYLVSFTRGKRLDDYWKAFINKQYKIFRSINKPEGETPFDTYKEFISGSNFFNMPVNERAQGHEFLNKIDSGLYKVIRDALNDTGYKGLFSGTNKWFGYNNLLSNYEVSDYIDSHGYFGRVSDFVKHGDYYSFTAHNKSYIDALADEPQNVLHDNPFGLNRILASHLVDKPFILSEWGHNIWSDFGYEGPSLVTTYSSVNGVDGLNVHTMYNNPRPSYKDRYPRDNHTVLSNPLLTSMLPSLALAFTRGDIAELQNKKIYCAGKTRQEIINTKTPRPEISKELEKMFVDNEFGSVRVALLDECVKDNKKISPTVDKASVEFVKSKSGATMIVSTEKFVSLTGNLNNPVINGENIITSVDVPSKGFISLISLDNEPLKKSSCMLMTTSYHWKNSNSKIQYEGIKKRIEDIGKEPTLLRNMNGVSTLRLLDAGKYSAYKIFKDGVAVKDKVTEYPGGLLKINIDTDDTPWRIITTNNCHLSSI